jgi:hypothetical protein
MSDPIATGRRALAFGRVEEILPEVDRLLAGHATLGRWSLGMICRHLATAIRDSVEGYPFRMPWAFRRTVGPLGYRWLDRRGRMPSGLWAPKAMIPPTGLDDRAEAESLRRAIALYRDRGPIAEHPLFGRFRPEQWDRLHCIHAAHHLGFALPRSAGL